MAKNSKEFGMEDVLFTALGGLTSFAVNPLVNKAVANQPEQTRKMVGTGLPIAKGGVGVYLATSKKQSRKVRFFGAGMAAASTVELGIKVQPNLFSINGTGDLYNNIGVTYPIAPRATLKAQGMEEMTLRNKVPARMPQL
ncbi:MAG: hypothetical protein AAF705_12660 [Bacteroidota bacterium]